jgi:hypothetical protein
MGEQSAFELGSAAQPIRDPAPVSLPEAKHDDSAIAQTQISEVQACLASLEPLLATAEGDDDYIVLTVHAILCLSGFELCEAENCGVGGAETVDAGRIPLPKAWRRGANGFRFEYVQPEWPERIQLHAVSIGRFVNFHARVGRSATIFRLSVRPSEFSRQTVDRPTALSVLAKTVTTKLARRMQFALLGVPSGFHSFGELFRAIKLHILAYLPVGAVGLVMQVSNAMPRSLYSSRRRVPLSRTPRAAKRARTVRSVVGQPGMPIGCIRSTVVALPVGARLRRLCNRQYK